LALLAVLSTALVGTVIAVSSVSAAKAASSETPGHARRMLVFSLPGVSWSDITPETAPTLSGLIATSGMADLVTRADRQPASLGAAYVTIGAGTRSATATSDGDALQTDERFGNVTAADAYRQRMGQSPGPGIVQLGIAQITASNAALLYDSHVGALGDALRDAGYRRAVIANADHSQPDTPPNVVQEFDRPAVSALMGALGIVRDGAVGPNLLQTDRTAPYGVRLNQRAVTSVFQRVWRDRTVVLVEASDLERADLYGTFATSQQASALRARALQQADALASQLLTHIDLRHDGVMILGPTSRPGDRSMTVAALHAPGVRPGLLRTATTRRDGFVALADVAPTILDTLGLHVPASMEGRPMQVATTAGSAATRRSFLISANDDGLLRDSLVAPVTNFVAYFAIALALATLLLVGRVQWARRWLQLGALGLVGFLVATFVVAPLHVAQHGGAPAFWTFTIVVALAFAVGCCVLMRRGPADPLMLALGLMVLLLTVDNFTHDHFEFNAVFGYSATVGIRLAGNSNTAFALLGASATVLAGLIAWRFATSRGTSVAIAMLAVVLVAFTPPFFGQDFGGTLAAAPAFLVLAWLLLGRRIRARTCLAFAAVLLLSGLAVGFLDLLRPANQRTHVGRFFAQVGNQGWSGFATVLQRKGTENASTLGQWMSMVVVVAVVGAAFVLWFRAPHHLQQVAAAIPTLRAAVVGLAVLAVLGYALNDSGIAIPALMCSIVAVTGAFPTSHSWVGADEGDRDTAPGSDRLNAP
jgi:hypothetical protein